MAKVKRPQSTRKRPLAVLLTERGIFDTEDEARRWVMSGQVLANGQRIDKPGMLVPGDAVLHVLGRHRYASRGGYKLEAALAHFDVTVAGRVALDSGASTGGFTDCLLQHGAALVYAVEAGHGQLLGRLRADPRVRNLERTNLSDLISTALDPPPTLITLDLSYLSLTKALPIATSILAPEGEVLALFKPLFEVDSATARRSGRVEDPALLVEALRLDLSYLSLTRALPIAADILAPEGEVLALFKPLFEVDSATARRTGHLEDPVLLVEALRRVLKAGAEAGLAPLGTAKLALRPRHGVVEFFVYLARNTSRPSRDYNDTTLTEIIAGPGIGNVEEE